MPSAFSRPLGLPLLLFLFGLLFFGLRDLTGYAQLGAHYTPFSAGPEISALTFDESTCYAPSAHLLAVQGRLFADDIEENRAKPLPMPSLHTLFVAPLIKIVGVETAWVMARVFFPALALVIFFLLFGSVTPRVGLRLFFSLACLTVAFGPRNAFLSGALSLIQPLEATRFPNPGLSFCLLLAVCYATQRYLENGKLKWGVAAGISLGAMAYAYYFYALVLGIALAFVWMAFLLLREKTALRRLSLIIAVSVILASPYAWVVVKAGSYIKTTLLRRIGLYQHTPEWRGLFLAAVMATTSVFLFRRRAYRAPAGFWISLLALLLFAAGIGLNAQVITGYEAQHEHFWNRLVQPISLALAFSLVTWLLRDRKQLAPVANAAWAGVILLIALGGYRQVSSALRTQSQHDRRADKYRAMEWIRAHAPVDSVVGSSDRELIVLLPAVTGRWNFIPLSYRTSVDDMEILNRYFAVKKEEGTSFANVAAEWKDTQQLHVWRNTYFILFGNPNPPMGSFMDSVQELWNGVDASLFLKNHRLDYLISTENLESRAPWRPVFHSGEWKVFRRAKLD